MFLSDPSTSAPVITTQSPSERPCERRVVTVATPQGEMEIPEIATGFTLYSQSTRQLRITHARGYE